MTDYPKHELEALANMKPNEKANYQVLLDVKYAVLDLTRELHLSRRAQNQQVQRIDGLIEEGQSSSKLAKVLNKAGLGK